MCFLEDRKEDLEMTDRHIDNFILTEAVEGQGSMICLSKKEDKTKKKGIILQLYLIYGWINERD